MDKTRVVLAVSTLLMVGAAPAFAAHQDILGHTVPDSTAEGWDGTPGARSRDGAAADARGATWLTQETYGQMGKKLGRGLVNAATGWIEFPKEIYRVSRESNPVFGVVLGGFSGLELSAVRTLAGVYEAATFPVPLPAGYVPVVSPNFVFTREGLYLWSFSS